MTTATRPRIDPRIAERRNQVLRAAGRRRLRALMAFLTALMLGAGALALTQTPVLDIDRVDVFGSERTSPAAIRSVAGLELGRPLLDVDLPASVRSIETLPWVLRAEVTRRWPGTLEVRIVERVPAAAVARPDGSVAVVDRRGRVLALAPSPPFGLTVVRGAKPPGVPGSTVPRATLDGVRAAAAMPSRLRPLVQGVVLAPGGLELGVEGGGVVRLGDATALEDKMQAALTVLVRIPPKRILLLDVRVPRAPVLTRR